MTQTQNKILKEWKTVNLSSVLDIIDGDRGVNYPKNDEFSDKGYCLFLNTGNVPDENFNFSSSMFITKEKDNLLRKGKLSRGDYVLTTRGTLGNFAHYSEKIPYLNIRINSGMVILRPKTNYLLSNYLYQYLRSKEFKYQVLSLSSGSAQPQLPIRDLKLFEILLPPLPEQKAIAGVLSSLDDKIELLREENKTLEEMAQVLFKRWFADFEFPCLPEKYKFSGARRPDDFESVCIYSAVGGLPVPQAGKHFLYVLLCGDGSFYIGTTNDLYRRWYEHKTGQGAKWTKTNQPVKVIHWEEFDSQQQAAARERELKTGFGRKWLKREYQAGRLRQAGKMLESELGEIPEGWRVGKVSNLVNLTIGRTPPRKEEEWFTNSSKDIKWISIKDLGNSGVYIFDSSEYLTKEAVEKFNIPAINPNTLILSFKLTIGRLSITTEKMLSNEAIAHFNIDNNQITTEFLYLYFKNYDFNKVGSTSSIATAINSSSIKNIEIVVPNQEVLEQFQITIRPIFNKIFNNSQQMQTLSQLRDSLLPKLMRGDIRIK